MEIKVEDLQKRYQKGWNDGFIKALEISINLILKMLEGIKKSKKKMNEISNEEIEEAFFKGAFYSICECGHYNGEHENGNGKCKKYFCKCIKYN